jgi:hypothetical protein
MLANILKCTAAVKQVEYVTVVSSTSDLTTYSFTGVSIGAAAGNRYIILGVTGSSGTTSAISTVTVNTVAATLLAQASGSTVATGLYIYKISSGTTADISVTFAGSKQRCAVSVWRVTGIDSETPYNTNSNTAAVSTSSLSTTVNTVNGGFIVAAAQRGGTVGGTTTWTGVSENYDFNLESRILTGGSLSQTVQESGRTVSTAFSTSGAAGSLVVASF